MTTKTLWLAVLGGAVLWPLWRWARANPQRLLQKQPVLNQAKARETTNWESEGGALPASGAQLGPASTLP